MIDLRDELADAVTSIPPKRLAYLTGLGIPEDFIRSGPHRIAWAGEHLARHAAMEGGGDDIPY